jgi:hypothetical protein
MLLFRDLREIGGSFAGDPKQVKVCAAAPGARGA